ncbi:dynein regulatory complex protein 9-like [Macrobrachium nipponense]|uniref:dynein regulatory complex protein 9-like n=1 Tax=Macrobrachium nipponense TaxID=159736 RepID=UPI0030C7CCDA
MKGAPHHIHLREGAIPYACHTPIPVPKHWEADVKAQLDEDVKLGVIREVPAGTEGRAQSKADFIALFQGEKWKAKYFEKSNKLQMLQRELRAIRQDTQKLMQAKDEEIAELRADIEKLTDTNPKRENYENKIAKARVENLQFRVEQEEERICKQIARVGREIPQEIRVHDALTAFLKECCAKLEAKSAEWDETFQVDTDAKKEEVSAWKAEVQSKKKELEDLEKKYQEYWVVVSVYEAEQEVERLKREEAEREFKAAAKIQAWWRGYMVRKGMSSGLRKKKKSKKCEIRVHELKKNGKKIFIYKKNIRNKVRRSMMNLSLHILSSIQWCETEHKLK